MSDPIVEVGQDELLKLRALAQHHQEIVDQQKTVSRLHDRWLAAKDASLAAKKTYDEAVNELRDCIAEGPDCQLKLFDTRPIPDQDWSKFPVDRLDLTATLKKKIADAEINTVGRLKDVLASRDPGFPDGLEKVKGFTAIVIAKLDAAVSKFVLDDATAAAKSIGVEEEFDGLSKGDPGNSGHSIQEGLDEAEETDPFSDQEALDGPWADQIPANQVEALEDSSSASSPQGRVKLTVDVARMESLGFVKGAEFSADMVGDSAVITLESGQEVCLTVNEFIALTAQEATA